MLKIKYSFCVILQELVQFQFGEKMTFRKVNFSAAISTFLRIPGSTSGCEPTFQIKLSEENFFFKPSKTEILIIKFKNISKLRNWIVASPVPYGSYGTVATFLRLLFFSHGSRTVPGSYFR